MTYPSIPANPYQSIEGRRPPKWRDFDLNFRRNPVTNDLMLKDDDGSIKQSIKNLVLTSYYESPKQVGLGTNITSSLFENYSWELEMFIRRAVGRAIVNNEPRVKLVDVICGTDQDGTVRVRVEYLIIGLLGKKVLEFPFERSR